MLEKLENAYLAVLRLTALSAAGAALLATFFLAGSAGLALMQKAEVLRMLPVVGTTEVKGRLMWTVGALQWRDPTQPSPSPLFVASGTQYYEPAVEAIVQFAREVGFSIEPGQVAAVIAKRTALLPESDQAAYAEGLANALQRILNTSSVVQVTKKDKSFNATVNGVMNAYSSRFIGEERLIEKRQSQLLDESRRRRALALDKLAYAAASLLAFFVLSAYVLLLRLERHLHTLERLTRAPTLTH